MRMVDALALGRLERTIQREAKGLAPSIELPWTPPWGDDVAPDVVELLADLAVLQADVAAARTWTRDDAAALRRRRAVDDAEGLAERAADRGAQATAARLRAIASSLRAWEALAPRS